MSPGESSLEYLAVEIFEFQKGSSKVMIHTVVGSWIKSQLAVSAFN